MLKALTHQSAILATAQNETAAAAPAARAGQDGPTSGVLGVKTPSRSMWELSESMTSA